MSRGVTETTRGQAHYPKEQSYLVQRHATPADLAKAREKYIGKQIPLRPAFADVLPPPYRCVDVRLDEYRRLLLDLVRVDSVEGEAGHA